MVEEVATVSDITSRPKPAPRISSEEFHRHWSTLTHRKRAEIALQASEENRTVWACFEEYLAESRAVITNVKETE